LSVENTLTQSINKGSIVWKSIGEQFLQAITVEDHRATLSALAAENAANPPSASAGFIPAERQLAASYRFRPDSTRRRESNS
jgi:hypothetical protein